MVHSHTDWLGHYFRLRTGDRRCRIVLDINIEESNDVSNAMALRVGRVVHSAASRRGKIAARKVEVNVSAETVGKVLF